MIYFMFLYFTAVQSAHTLSAADTKTQVLYPDVSPHPLLRSALPSPRPPRSVAFPPLPRGQGSLFLSWSRWKSGMLPLTTPSAVRVESLLFTPRSAATCPLSATPSSNSQVRTWYITKWRPIFADLSPPSIQRAPPVGPPTAQTQVSNT